MKAKFSGDHFNPDARQHGGPDDRDRHAGDLGNIRADASGAVRSSQQDTTISLQGRNSVVGRALVIHQQRDDLGRGGNDESRRNGNSGGRIACEIIGIQEEL